MKLSRAAIQLWMRTAIAGVVCILAGHAFIQAERGDGRLRGPSDGAGAAVLERFLADSDAPLTSYRALRRLEATTPGGRMHARLTAWTSVDPDFGFQYSIVEEDGSGLIRRKVLRPALEAEGAMRAAGELGRGALTRKNYEFTAAAAAEAGLVRIGIHPKRRDTLLVEGSILLTELEGHLARVEGALVKRPSFWTRRVEVVREYARIGGVRVPISLRSTAQVLVVGRSTFSMTYEYTSINGFVAATAASPASN